MHLWAKLSAGPVGLSERGGRCVGRRVWWGLSDDQQAVVKGRALGDFKLYVISRAMRSVYPDFVNRRRHAVIIMVEGSH